VIAAAGMAAAAGPAVLAARVAGHEIRRRWLHRAGRPGRPVALLVHGMAENGTSWGPLVPALRQVFDVVALDLPWSGEEGVRWPSALAPGDWLREGLALCQEPPAVVVGHSFGASVLLEWLAREERARAVSAAVLIAPFFKPRPECFDWEVLSYYVNRFHELLEQGMRARAGARRLPADFVAAMAEKVRERIAPAGWMEFFRIFMRSPELPLEKITCPVRVVVGDRDISVAVDDCRALVERLPAARLDVLAGCGHYCLLERPEETIAATAGHLTRSRHPGAAGRGGRLAR